VRARPRVIVVASARSIAQVLSPEAAADPHCVRRGSEMSRDRVRRRSRRYGVPARAARRTPRRDRGAWRHRRRLAGPGTTNRSVSTSSATKSSDSRSFDIANQRSTWHDLDEAVIAPAREWLPGREDTRERAERDLTPARRGAESDLRPLRHGPALRRDGRAGWDSSSTSPRTLLDEVSAPPWSWSSPTRVRTPARGVARRRARTHRRRRGDLAGERRSAAAARLTLGRRFSTDASIVASTRRRHGLRIRRSRRRRSSRATRRGSPRTYGVGRRTASWE
jgi:hypothetical protein